VRRTAARFALAAIILSTFGTIGSAARVVEIRLRGHYFPAPATVIVNIAIEPASDNYQLLVEADSETFFRASQIDLAGMDEKRVHTLQFKNLPGGEYSLRAELRSKTDVLGQATQALTVTGMGGR
jgi:hypothetical protein